MDPADSRLLVRRYYAAWDTGDLDLLDAVCAPNIAVYFPGRPDGIHDLRSLKEIIRAVRRSIPDLRLRIEEELVDGERVALRWTASGTQKESWVPGIPPTGKNVWWSGISLYRISGGQIVEERVEEDLLQLQTQMGVVAPVRPPTRDGKV